MDARSEHRLLEADLSELRGVSDGDVGRLVRQDPEARALATMLANTMQHADAFLTRESARLRPAVHVTPIQVRSGPRTVPLIASLAAATLAVIVLSHTIRVRPLAPPAARPPSLVATLNASSPRLFAVIATDNPDIAIVWLKP